MFKILFTRLIERTVIGKPVQAFLAEATTISRKTWDSGCPKRPAAKARAAKELDAYGFEHLRNKGLSNEEIEAWLSKFPAATDEKPYCLSTFIGVFSIAQDQFQETLALAKGMDELAHELQHFRHDNNFSALKHTLLDRSRLPPHFFANTDQEFDSDDTPSILRQLQTAKDCEDLDDAIKVVMANIIFTLMASFDIEFCRARFPENKPFPLFETVMPHLTEAPEENLKISRDMFRRPTRNLLDILAAMGNQVRNHAYDAQKKIRVKEMAAWLELGEPQITAQKLWNWRNGRDAFLLEEFDLVWRRFAGAYDNETQCQAIPTMPAPLFFAARLWEILLIETDNNKKLRKFYLLQPRYLMHWERLFSRLTAKGISWGDRPWPAWICNQSSWSGCKSPDSSRSSQSSGRSSKSLDSQ